MIFNKEKKIWKKGYGFHLPSLRKIYKRLIVMNKQLENAKQIL